VGTSPSICSLEYLNIYRYDGSDGTFRVQYSINKGGLHNLHVTSNGSHITGSPFLVKVQPAEASPAHSYAHGEGLTRAAAGRTAKFVVQTADVFDNPIHRGGVVISSVLEGPQKVNAKVTDDSEGYYTVEYPPTQQHGCTPQFFFV